MSSRMLKAPDPNTSNNHNTHPPKKKCHDKVKWTTAEEVAIITALLDRRPTGMHPRVASALFLATGGVISE